MATTRTYSPAEILCSFGGIPITSFGPDTFVEAERAEDGWLTTVGASGEVVRSQNLNKLGTVTFTLLSASPENDLLSSIAGTDELSRQGIGALMIKDRIGTTLVHASEAWIQKLPKVERAKTSGTTVWMVTCARLEAFSGGNVS